jgi:hypothetical protein
VTTLAQTDTAQADLDPADDSPLWIVADQDAAEIAFTNGLAAIAVSRDWTLPNFHDRPIVIALPRGHAPISELGITGECIEYFWGDITQVRTAFVGRHQVCTLDGRNIWDLVCEVPEPVGPGDRGTTGAGTTGSNTMRVLLEMPTVLAATILDDGFTDWLWDAFKANNIGEIEE